MVALASSFAAQSQLLPDAAPLPVSATFNPAKTEMVVTFDSLMFSVTANPGNWFARVTNLNKSIPGAVTILGFTATFPLAGGSVDLGDDEVTYNGTDITVKGDNGLQVAAFSIPATLLP